MNTCELRVKLERLTTSSIKKLAKDAQVGERTLWKIRAGETETASERVKERVMLALKAKRRKPAAIEEAAFA